MTVQSQPGAIWAIEHDFGDGQGPRKKYVVILTSPPRTFVAFTTSKARRFHDQGSSPCLSKDAAFRIAVGWVKSFGLETYVSFKNIRETTEEFLVAKNGSFLEILKEDQIRAIQNCAKNSDDVEGIVLKAIERTQKAMNAQSKAQATQTSPHPLALYQPRFGAYCLDCRLLLVGLLYHSEAQVAAFLSGTAVAPQRFETNLKEALQMIDETDCSTCGRALR